MDPALGTLIADDVLERDHDMIDGRKEVVRKMGSGTVDKAKGRVKEAAGALTNDDKLRSEGKLDQAAGAVKNAAEKVVEKVKQAVHNAKD